MRFLHVANGTSTTRLIEAAGLPGLRSIWADPLYEGPVPGGLSDADLIEVRRRFLSALLVGLPGTGPAADPINDLREWRAVIARRDAWDQLVLWYEHDLFDQLNLIHVLTWIREHVHAAAAVRLVCIGTYPGHPDFKGLGELAPSDVAALFETRQAVDESQYVLARAAWTAFRASTPEPLDHLRRTDTSALPYLDAALTRFLQELPWTSDGLSRSERRLLSLVSAPGGMVLSHAFRRMHEDETAFYITDLSLAGLVSALRTTSPPLLAAAEGTEGNVFRQTIAIASAGREVLEHTRDRVRLCGIERWFGGVHLQGHGPVWRWDDAVGRVTMA